MCTCHATQGSTESLRGQLPTEGLEYRLIIWTWVYFLQTRWVLKGGLTNTCEIIVCLTLIPSFRNTSFSLWKPCSKLSLREEFLDLNPMCIYEKIYSEFQNAILGTTSPVSCFTSPPAGNSTVQILQLEPEWRAGGSGGVVDRGGRSRARQGGLGWKEGEDRVDELENTCLSPKDQGASVAVWRLVLISMTLTF